MINPSLITHTLSLSLSLSLSADEISNERHVSTLESRTEAMGVDGNRESRVPSRERKSVARA
jgi:hypothetical protein